MLHQQIRDEIKEALKSKDELRLTVLRGLLTACTNELIANKRKPDQELSDDEVLALIKRGVKQRKDSIEQFTKGGRNDLAEREEQELSILDKYLPQMMGKDEIQKTAEAKIKELDVTDKSKMGILVGAIMKELQGKADGKDVKEVVESLLS